MKSKKRSSVFQTTIECTPAIKNPGYAYASKLCPKKRLLCAVHMIRLYVRVSTLKCSYPQTDEENVIIIWCELNCVVSRHVCKSQRDVIDLCSFRDWAEACISSKALALTELHLSYIRLRYPVYGRFSTIIREESGQSTLDCSRVLTVASLLSKHRDAGIRL